MRNELNELCSEFKNFYELCKFFPFTHSFFSFLFLPYFRYSSFSWLHLVKDHDHSQAMEDADREGELFVRLSIKALALGCPGSEIIMAIVSLIYCISKYGTVDGSHLYRPYKTRYMSLVYHILSSRISFFLRRKILI